jgi:hypothetical protein
MKKNETHDVDIELKKLELEQQRIELERDKLEVEKVKARWTSLSILIPLLIVTITLGTNLYFQNIQARREFEIQAAQIVMNTANPGTIQSKAQSLAALFPNYLPDDFATSFNPREFSQPGFTEKRELLIMVYESSNRAEIRQEVIDLWRQFYPGDNWAQEVFDIVVVLDGLPEATREVFLHYIFPAYR